MKDSSMFFIFGSPRSGTSLLSRMLNKHTSLAVPYESHYFNTFGKWQELYGDLSVDDNRRRLIEDVLSTDVMQDWSPSLELSDVEEALNEPSFPGVFEGIMRAYASKTGKRRWGEKTPHHVHYWQTINQAFPGAKIIHIVRDGRDVALSLLNARFGPKSLYGCARYWSAHLERIEAVKKELDPTRFHQLHYETLVTDPESVLRGVCDFLAEPYQESMLEFYKDQADYKTDAQNQRNLNSPLLAANVNKWQQNMSRRDSLFFDRLAGDDLVRYGYQVSPESRGNFLLLEIRDRFMLGPLRKGLAMIRNLKGHRDGFIKLMIYFRLKRFTPRVPD
ncbi:MAG: sulfotransferase [Desulfobulbaceae bacterium]|nr:MAG: sulfotransferase [Desulfobulbaceae bacterium]